MEEREERAWLAKTKLGLCCWAREIRFTAAAVADSALQQHCVYTNHAGLAGYEPKSKASARASQTLPPLGPTNSSTPPPFPCLYPFSHTFLPSLSYISNRRRCCHDMRTDFLHPLVLDPATIKQELRRNTADPTMPNSPTAQSTGRVLLRLIAHEHDSRLQMHQTRRDWPV